MGLTGFNRARRLLQLKDQEVKKIPETVVKPAETPEPKKRGRKPKNDNVK